MAAPSEVTTTEFPVDNILRDFSEDCLKFDENSPERTDMCDWGLDSWSDLIVKSLLQWEAQVMENYPTDPALYEEVYATLDESFWREAEMFNPEESDSDQDEALDQEQTPIEQSFENMSLA